MVLLEIDGAGVPRMTTRRWMAAVAVVAIFSMAVRALPESARRLRTAKRYARLESNRRTAAYDKLAEAKRSDGIAASMLRLDAAIIERRADYYAGQRYEFVRAALLPWIAVETKPGEP